MFSYKCHACGGLCDPGELENGVCFDCRSAAEERKEERNHQVILEARRIIRARQALEQDGKVGAANG